LYKISVPIVNAKDFRFTFGASNSRLVGAEPRIWELILVPEYELTLTAQNGLIQSTARTLANTQIIEGIPNLGYIFTGWTGDASGTENPLSITMDADKTVGANFEQDLSDSDNDGLTAYDELLLYGTDPALADTDGDGLSDGYELGIGRFSIVPGALT
jgi:uncharacterized repeat protein (TIGR02543 family)